MAEIFSKYFFGYQSSLSIDLVTNAIDLHYQGLSEMSKRTFSKGLSMLCSRCGQAQTAQQGTTIKEFGMTENSDSFSATDSERKHSDLENLSPMKQT